MGEGGTVPVTDCEVPPKSPRLQTVPEFLLKMHVWFRNFLYFRTFLEPCLLLKIFDETQLVFQKKAPNNIFIVKSQNLKMRGGGGFKNLGDTNKTDEPKFLQK